MNQNSGLNRKLLVSVFNTQETREAIMGGGRIIDSEDPRGALGCISPLQVMEIADTVVSYKKNMDVQLSTNIGEEQYIYNRWDDGFATIKSTYEIKSKAAQAAIGVARAMGTEAHPCNLVKVGVDRMPEALIKEVLSEIVTTLKYSEGCRSSQVMAIFFIQDMEAWNERKKLPYVRKELVALGKYISADEDDKDAFDLRDYAINNLRNWDNEFFFDEGATITLESLISCGLLREGTKHTFVKLNELRPHSDFFPNVEDASTTRAVLSAMVDVTAESGCGSIMLDNRSQSKISRICSVDTSSEGLVDINPYLTNESGLAYHGVLSLDDIKFFVDYCHHKGIEANLAGSLQSLHAQQIWVKAPQLDQMSNRDAASAILVAPESKEQGLDTRQHRVIKATLVRGIVPPEQGGVLNVPQKLSDNTDAMSAIRETIDMVEKERDTLGLPKLKTYFTDLYGVQNNLE